MLTLLAVIFVFGLLVFVHEFGHFFVARKNGVKVEEFAFGFPPKIWSKKKGDTTYAINAIPFGGYVKLYGENDESSKEKNSYASKSKLQKAQILLAGVVMNFLLAVLILTIGYAVGMKGLFPGMEKYSGVVNNQKVLVTDVQKDSPAEKEGILKGDKIKSVDGQGVILEGQVMQLIRQKTQGKPDEKVNMELERDGKTFTKSLQTFEDKARDERNNEITVRKVGIAMQSEGQISAPFYLAPVIAAQEAFRIAGLTVQGLGQFFAQLFTTLTISKNIGGPVEIVMITGTTVAMGFMSLLQFTAILSISLAIVNLLPIPALDGGHLFLMLAEKIFGRDFSQKAKNALNAVGFGLILLLTAVLLFRGLRDFVF